MTDFSKIKRRLASDVASYGGTVALRSVIPFLMLPFYTHLLAPEEFGAIDTIVVIIALVNMLVLQFNVGYMRYFYREQEGEKRKDYTKTVFTFFLAAAVAGAAGMSVLGYFFSGAVMPGVEEVPMGMVFLAIAFLPQTITEFALVNMRLVRQRGMYAATSVIDSVLRGGLALVFIWFLGMGVAGYCLGVLIGSAAVCAMVLASRPGFLTGRFDGKLMREITRFTLPTLPGVFLGYVNQYGTRFIMLAFLSLKEIAIYALAMKVAKLTKLCVQGFRNAWQPMAMEHVYEDNSDQVFSKVLDIFVIVAVTILVGMSLVSAPLVRLISPEEYFGASRLVPYLVAAALISSSSAILDLGNQISENTKWISIATGAGSVVTLSLSYLLVSAYGVLAIAIGLMLGSAVSTFVLYSAGLVNHRIPYRWQSVATIILGLPVFVLIVFRG